jgi:hypothetical protein
MTEDDWTGIDFNAALKKYTVLEPITTGAVVDATSLADVSDCRANSYNRKKRDFNTLSSEEYQAAECDDNDYYDPEKTKIKETSQHAMKKCCSADGVNSSSKLSEREKKEREKWCKMQGLKVPQDCPSVH